MVPALQEVDARRSDEVDETVFLGQAAGPGAGELVLQRLRLADAGERVAQHGLDEAQEPQGGRAVVLDPPGEVGEEVPVEERLALGGGAQAFGSIPARFLSRAGVRRAPAPFLARASAARSRSALAGERKRCAVSSSPRSSEAAMRATVGAPRRVM